MKKTCNDSDLDRLSADLDEELTAIFNQVEAALGQGVDQWDEVKLNPAHEDNPSAQTDKAVFSLDDNSEALNIELENSPSLTDPAGDETDWLPPGLLGEPEMPAGLTPEVMRELGRIIEEAVEKGVAAALAKLKTG